jgi:hypothetical protein
VIKFFKWLKNVRDIRDLRWDDKLGDSVELVANMGDILCLVGWAGLFGGAQSGFL